MAEPIKEAFESLRRLIRARREARRTLIERMLPPPLEEVLPPPEEVLSKPFEIVEAVRDSIRASFRRY